MGSGVVMVCGSRSLSASAVPLVNQVVHSLLSAGRGIAVGCAVNVDAASYVNSIGDVMQMAYWEDPDFDPKERAFYYVRVLEIPTPRWTTHDAAYFGVDLPKGVPAEQQERAYTSPIWYTP